MATRKPIAVGEWYHCYNRGTDKRTVFGTPQEYERFLVHLYISNSTRNIRASNVSDSRLSAVLLNERLDRGEPLVEIGAYALMPTHIHLLLKEIRNKGIATFMQKVFTGYTMYFNNKHKRTGGLFAGTFKSKHIENDRYLKQVLPYILLNPIELFEPRWKKEVGLINRIEKKILEYPYSSLPDFYGISRPQNKIVTTKWDEYYDRQPTLASLLKNARTYHQENQQYLQV